LYSSSLYYGIFTFYPILTYFILFDVLFSGQPHKVTTVDRFQGQQNDYIILSLVRTRNVGHLRDVRRLVVSNTLTLTLVDHRLPSCLCLLPHLSFNLVTVKDLTTV